MTTNNDEFSKEADTVETEVAKGEQNEVLEEHPQLEKIKEKPCSKLTAKTMKPTARKLAVKRISPRFEELAQPIINNVLSTLRDKAWVLPPALIDNLTRMIETKTCLSPEEAAQVLRRKKRKTKKVTQFPLLIKKWTEETIKPSTVLVPPMLDGNMAVCQYLLATNFVKSILERRCQTRRKDFREITRVILRHLTSINEYMDTRNGSERATQQLHFLAEIIACWVAEIRTEVAEANKETLKQYYNKRKMKEMEVDDDNEEEEEEDMDREVEYWKQLGQKYDIQKKSEDEMAEREKEKKNEDVEDEKVEQEQNNEEYMEQENEEVSEREK